VTFIDTNVLVYAAAGGHRCLIGRAPPWRKAADGPVTISRQVLREYLSVMTRHQTWGKPLTLSQAVSDTAGFVRQFTVLEDGPSVWEQLIMLSRRYSFAGRQVHDANIVATMLAHGERRLLTLNVADFRRFARLIDVLAL
jgi:predicted nucleic acid-binding protein